MVDRRLRAAVVRGRCGALLAVLALAACGSGTETKASGWSPADATALDLSWSGAGDVPGGDAPTEAGASDAVDSAGGDAAPTDAAKPDAAKADTSADVAVPVDTKPPEDVAEDVAVPEPVCGDAACTGGETWSTCSADCAAPPSVCGDGVCTPGENAISCQIDCDPDTVGVVTCLKKSCASATSSCLAGTECTAFLANAAQCLANCVDANCVAFCKDMADQNPGAGTVAKCGFDGCASATAGTICGDGTCDVGETTANCAPDCPAPPTSGGSCGNGNCGTGETAATCPIDCDADFAKAWACGAAKCPTEAAACKADPACLDALAKAANCVKQCGTGSTCVGQCRGPVLGNSKALSFAMCGLQNCQ